MGKERKTKKKRHRSSTSPTRKRRFDRNSDEETVSDSSSLSEIDQTVVDNSKSIGAYINDRNEMVNQMFKSLQKGDHLDAIMPDILKNVPLDELKKMCVDELEGMSKKRIRLILAGEEMTSSSGTDESSSSDESEPIVPLTSQLSDLSPRKPTTISVDQQQQAEPDSTSMQVEKHSNSMVEVEKDSREIEEKSEDDDFGLEGPLVDIVLEEPSPQRSPEDGGVEVKEFSNEEESNRDSEIEATTKVDSEIDAMKKTDLEDDDESDFEEEERREIYQVNSSDDSEIEDGEIPTSSKRKRLEEKSFETSLSDTNGKRTEDLLENRSVELIDRFIGKSSDQPIDAKNDEKEDEKSNEENIELENEDEDDDLVAEVRAQDEILFGEIVATSNRRDVEISEKAKNDDDKLEFLEEPISKSTEYEKENSTKIKDGRQDFTWSQRVPTKPYDGNEEEKEKETEDSFIVEQYDDAWPQSNFSSTNQLLPPGFEQPSTSSKKKSDSPKGNENANSTKDSESKTGSKSILPIRTLYNQLKAQRLAAAAKKLAKPKLIYGPQQLKRIRRELPKAAGPELPPILADNQSDQSIIPGDRSKIDKSIKKPKKKSTSSDVLTPEFLAELERKKLEYERNMKEKMELLENLKAKRQKVTNRERDIEEDLRKQLELGLFDKHESETRLLSKKKRMTEIIDSEEISDENILTIDSSLKGEARRVDADEDYLLIVSDADDDDFDSETDQIDKSIEIDRNQNSKFPSITISVKASTSGQSIRSVIEKGKVTETKEEWKSETVVRSSVGIVDKSISKSIESITEKRKTDLESESRYRPRYEPRYDDRRRSHVYHRSSTSSRSERRSTDDTEKRRFPNDDRYRVSDRKRKNTLDKSVVNAPTPTLPVVDESFQKQAELLELELRAKAIRSLMKVQDELKDD